MRNGLYTIYKGNDLLINSIRDNDNEVHIKFEGENCPFPEFHKSEHEKNVFLLKTKSSELQKMYWVKTYGIFKGYKFEVFDKKNGPENIVQIAIRDEKAIKELYLFGDKNWAFIDINKSELEKIWEERKSANSFPLPEDVLPVFEIR